jgi:leader peptidase (prepilin peptidase)/N-methyltransferase
MYSFFLFLLGLCFGSFATALSWRIPHRISFVKGRSICPNCKSQISWYDNIPLLSYLLLGGKCRKCKTKISARYPIIELSSAFGFLIIGLYSFPDLIATVYRLIIFVLLLIIFIIDLENQIIPDSLTFTGLFIVAFYLILGNQQFLFPLLFSGFVAASLLMLIHLMTKGRGMGLGDVKFAVLGGMLIGLKLLPIWLLLAFLTGAVVGIILIIVGKAGLKSKIAFGPFLIIGIPLALLYGEKIFSWLHFN